MFKIVYRDQKHIDRFTIIESEKTCTCISYFTPNGTSLLYCKKDRYNYITIDKDMIISINEI